ncbi:helix-turn-helix domain-containing protein [Streptomyces sp. wa1]|uniref:helix-turn-helix domain-containing protein n=1 Tax=Streptomyces sp. wa1 TaxID=1828184 RepID=UPI003C79F9D0
MGRREKPVGADCVARMLALWLRRQRERAGISYRELARRTKYSEDTLRRAASGKVVPTLRVVRTFADACGADPRKAERLRTEAHARHGRSKRTELKTPLLNIEYLNTFHELRRCMIDAYERAGSPSYRELAANPDIHGPLSRSSLSRFFWNKSNPSRAFTLAFARSCGQSQIEPWARAWERCSERSENQPVNRPHPVRTPTSPFSDHLKPEVRIHCEGCYRRFTIAAGSPPKTDSQFWCSSCFTLRMRKFKNRTADIKLRRFDGQNIFEIFHRCAESKGLSDDDGPGGQSPER